MKYSFFEKSLIRYGLTSRWFKGEYCQTDKPGIVSFLHKMYLDSSSQIFFIYHSEAFIIMTAIRYYRWEERSFVRQIYIDILMTCLLIAAIFRDSW